MKNKKTICSIGEILIDAYNINGEEKFEIGGASFNVAVSLKTLGNEILFFGAIGNDEYAQKMLETFASYELNTKYLKNVNNHSTIAKVILDKNNDRNFIFTKGADQNFDLDLNLIDKKIDFIHFGSATAFLNGKLEISYFKLLDYALKNNIPYSFDPNYRDNLINNSKILEEYKKKCLIFIKNATFIKFSTEEAYLLSGLNNIENSLLFFGNLNPSALICITQGKEDTLFYWKAKTYYVPIKKIANVIDTTGAGDAFVSGVIHYLLKYNFSSKSSAKEILKIIKLGNEFASKNVEYLGALTFLNYI
ncbi:carbohydrate kinase family protein [Williamsoniiplasma lucivorax]|uniref:Fructokinase n=1 Tax=Williamsoniiplasma lucivorax TaxID=209274 RepID=A0A2S5RA84_9MOLU|nr:carbohydrate kinase [Williamsoniiplasma lucivorax]PPE04102.1 fructokinase [Williamsoniiplasma lucivorax]